MAAKKTCSKLFKQFKNKYVTFILKNVRNGIGGSILNLSLEGYLLDEDEEYFYIGITSESITGAIRRLEVATILETEPDFKIPEGTNIQ